jgi:hypothetical protein
VWVPAAAAADQIRGKGGDSQEPRIIGVVRLVSAGRPDVNCRLRLVFFSSSLRAALAVIH